MNALLLHKGQIKNGDLAAYAKAAGVANSIHALNCLLQERGVTDLISWREADRPKTWRASA